MLSVAVGLSVVELSVVGLLSELLSGLLSVVAVELSGLLSEL